MIEVDIIIVNFNSGRYLHKCLDSLFTSNISISPNYNVNVIIIDNGSTDDSLNMEIKDNNKIKIIKNSTNIGFAAACNQGAKDSTADYLLFLNPDTQLYPDSLEKPLSFMEKPGNSDVAILGIQLVDQEYTILKTCVRFPKLKIFLFKMIGLNKIFPRYNHFMVDWDHLETREVDQVMGAYFLIRRKVFDQLDGFDERFFVYFEELDLSLRVFQAGWKSVYYTEVQAIHEGGGSSKNVKDKRLFYFLRSQIIYGYKHLGWFKGTILLLGTLFLEPISRFFLVAFRGSLQDIKNICGAYVMLFLELPHVFQLIKSLHRGSYKS